MKTLFTLLLTGLVAFWVSAAGVTGRIIVSFNRRKGSCSGIPET
jgi:hypothetical protein